MKKDLLSHSDLLAFIDGSSNIFEKWWQEGEENERRWMGKNYSEAQEREIRGQGRQPISVGQAAGKIRRVLGVQESQRTEFNILAATDPNDEIKAEIAKLQMHSIERRSGFENLETEVCTAGLAVKYGVSKMGLDYSNVFRRVKVESIDYRDFMWDSNSKEYDLNEDALWVCELEKTTRKLLNQETGIPTDVIKTLATGGNTSFVGRDKTSIYVSKNEYGIDDYDIITVFNFFIKVPKTVYYVIFPDSESLNGAADVIESKHNSRKAAEQRLRELQLPYILKGLPVEGSIEDKVEKGIDKYRFTYDRFIDHEETDYDMFPYNVFFATRFENLIASFMDYLKDPQKFYDRFIMQIDYALGKDNRQASQLNVDALADEETPTTALQKIEKGKTVLVRTYKQALQALESKGANPQWMGMIDLLSTILNDLGGGQQFQAKANAADSGTKTQTLIGQGELYAKPFLDNLRRWKICVGRNMLWWMQHYETAKDVIRVQGGALTPQMIQLLTESKAYQPSMLNDGSGFVTVNDEANELSYLKDSSFELFVTEEAMSDSEKHSQLLVAMTTEREDPMLQQSMEWRKYKLSLYDMPTHIRYKIIQELDQIKKEAEQQVKAAQDQLNQQSQQKADLEKAKVLGKVQGQEQMSADRKTKIDASSKEHGDKMNLERSRMLVDVASQ